jgi:hypothetical protein
VAEPLINQNQTKEHKMRYSARYITLITISIIWAGSVTAQSVIPSPEQQIAAAVNPLPESMQQEAKVLGYDQNGEMVTLREGSNSLICLTDNPDDGRFHVSCYHEALEPFMELGRQLRTEGYTGDEIDEIRKQEIENGNIHMPEKPMALYSLFGESDGWDYSSNTLRSARPLYVVYIPYATIESTGLAGSPVSQGAPWLMDPGTPWAHIMVGTGRQLGSETENGN